MLEKDALPFVGVLSSHVGVWLSFRKAAECVGVWCNMYLKTKQNRD